MGNAPRGNWSLSAPFETDGGGENGRASFSVEGVLWRGSGTC